MQLIHTPSHMESCQNLSRRRTIVDTEWAEVFKNRVVLMNVLLMPSEFTLLPIVMLIAMNQAGMCGVMSICGAVCSSCARFLASAWSLYHQPVMTAGMIMPIADPHYPRCLQHRWRKNHRSLEPCTPHPSPRSNCWWAKVWQPLPRLWLPRWGCFLIFLDHCHHRHYQPIFCAPSQPDLLVGVFLVAATDIMSVMFALLFPRVNDRRTAEQISAIMIVPSWAS